MATHPSDYLSAAPVRRVEEQRDQAVAIAQLALMSASDPFVALTRIALIDTEGDRG